MINSMTAFAKAMKQTDAFSVSIEIRSYNSKYLDILLRMPYMYNELEDRIKKSVSAHLERGRIEIAIKIKNESPDVYAFAINESMALAYHAALVKLKQTLKIDSPIELDLFTRPDQFIQSVETERDIEGEWLMIEACLSQAIAELKSMRQREGEFIGKDLMTRIDFIAANMEKVEKGAQDLKTIYYNRLNDRIKELTQNVVELDPARIAQEAAIIADKSDVSEEITRVKSHLIQFKKLLDSKEACGRKLNFLIQELFREFNTIGSKAGSTQIAHIVVDLKSEIERIREQVQNIE